MSRKFNEQLAAAVAKRANNSAISDNVDQEVEIRRRRAAAEAEVEEASSDLDEVVVAAANSDLDEVVEEASSDLDEEVEEANSDLDEVVEGRLMDHITPSPFLSSREDAADSKQQDKQLSRLNGAILFVGVLGLLATGVGGAAFLGLAILTPIVSLAVPLMIGGSATVAASVISALSIRFLNNRSYKGENLSNKEPGVTTSLLEADNKDNVENSVENEVPSSSL